MFALHKKPKPSPEKESTGIEIIVRISEPLVDKSITALMAGTPKWIAGGIFVVISAVLTGAYTWGGVSLPSVPTENPPEACQLQEGR